MKNAYILYIVMFITLTGAANSIKHLVRLGAWESFGFVVFKDLAVAILVVYLFRLSRAAQDSNTRNLAVGSMLGLLMISFISDAAIVLLKG